MNLAQLLSVFASDKNLQINYFEDAPEDAFANDFSRNNSILRAVKLYFGSISPMRGGGGSEEKEDWLKRVGISSLVADDRKHPYWDRISELSVILNLILESPRDILLTKHGLRSATEWDLVRKFSHRCLDTIGLKKIEPLPTFSSLWEVLEGDEIENWRDPRNVVGVSP